MKALRKLSTLSRIVMPLGLAAIGVAIAPVAHAKEYDIAGTVDCGVRSGRHCSIDNALNIWTDDVSGQRQLVTVDVSWIRRKLPGLDQDDAIDLEVTDRAEAEGGIQALGVRGEGNFVNRLNFGVREEFTTFNGSIEARVGGHSKDDEKLARKGIHRFEDLHKK